MEVFDAASYMPFKIYFLILAQLFSASDHATMTQDAFFPKGLNPEKATQAYLTSIQTSILGAWRFLKGNWGVSRIPAALQCRADS